MDSVNSRRMAVAELGDAVRELMEAVVSTDVSPSELLSAVDLVRGAGRTLASRRRPISVQSDVDDRSDGVQFYSAVQGRGNPVAVPLRFHSDDAGIVAEFVLGRRWEGPPGLVHGGVIALLLDEALGSAIAQAGHWGMTVNLSIDYARAIPIGDELLIRARLDHVDGRKIRASGSITSASDGATFATATGVFVAPRPERSREYFGEMRNSDGSPLDPRMPVADLERARDDGRSGEERTE